ncbi:polysaccharide lyase [Actinacidiphila oryziradicis]|uniref:polysaccharide lyase n=1 Tax=Actinacidiphila oryziradicis TaxID=2571141 RepID=UPI0023EF70FA|nr:hypothetical protein [Actinacidiphila oryziradicis]MCW2873697.1 hypothetical protein [Actinacidiphila oryziradicis]
MRRRQIITASATAVTAAAAALAGCSTSGSRPRASQSATPTSGTPLSRDAASASRFFGPKLLARSDGSFGLSRALLLDQPHSALGRLLRVRYPARSASPTVTRQYHDPEGGAQLYLALRSGPTATLHLRYYVRFPPEFDFVKGGKLPGLYGGSVTGGRHIPDGSDGLSTRYMWRKGGTAEVYAYLPTSVEHGTSLGRGEWLWPTGRWTCVEQAVHLNTPGRADGSVTVFLDGARVLRSAGLEFRSTGRLAIEGVFFSTFFGGSDPSWATPRTQHTDFAAFAVSDRYIGPVPKA